MNEAQNLAIGLFVFALAVALGFELINRVPATLHTPLMSGTNAIHGIVLVGALIVAANSQGTTAGAAIAVVAVLFGTINVVGGFVVTDRMLEMFKRRPAADPPKREG